MFITDSPDAMLDDLLARIGRKLEITSDQRDFAKREYVEVGRWLGDDDSPLTPFTPVIYAQGSLAIDTTVKPLKQDEFDLDLVCELAGGWRGHGPVETLDLIEKRLQQNGAYKPMVKRMNRCIRLDYPRNFHMDILPGYPDNDKTPGALKVPDRKLLTWKDSNPKGFAAWFDGKSRHHVFLEKAAKVEPFPDYDLPQDKPTLKKIVQLFKRRRDIAFSDDPDRAPISVVLTTLAANAYSGHYSVSEGLAETLAGIMHSIPSGRRLVVPNPTNPAEDFSEKWDNDRALYDSFLKWLRSFIREWNDIRLAARDGAGLPHIQKLLSAMFGEAVSVHAISEQQEYIQKIRNSGMLAIDSSRRGLVLAGSGGLDVKKNTFYGA
ncbi:MAG: nucleotidyltransferase [Sporomusaceae bacterium]|nr:nucleotidyltransferase [Sporomusaceae bacterium]